jgi:hypothetical protein
MKSQTKAIRKDLEKGRKITPMDALKKYGCFRLGARINDLRNEGMHIVTNMVTRNGKRVALYSLIGN